MIFYLRMSQSKIFNGKMFNGFVEWRLVMFDKVTFLNKKSKKSLISLHESLKYQQNKQISNLWNINDQVHNQILLIV